MRGPVFCARRRRRTSWPRDWSSDVCSSDLAVLMTATLTSPDSPEEVMPAGTEEAVGELLARGIDVIATRDNPRWQEDRSEEHTSELQSRGHLVCRLLLEKKKQQQYEHWHLA